MQCLSSFNLRLRNLRAERSLTEADVAEKCQVDEQLVRRWESADNSLRCFPNIDQLLALCYRTQTPLECLIDADELNGGQLELPGLAMDESDLGKALDELHQELSRRLPNSQEKALLQRFRLAGPDKQRLILQLLA